MTKENRFYKLIVVAGLVLFGLALFLSIRFLKTEINQALNPNSSSSSGSASAGIFNMDSFNKVLPRFK